MRIASPLDDETERTAKVVVDSAFQVHAALGPGLLESVYGACLALELDQRGVRYRKQVDVPVLYRGTPIDAKLRLDFLVAERIVVELKTVESVLDVHRAQLLTYLKLTGCRLGFLINFNVATIKTGISRIVL